MAKLPIPAPEWLIMSGTVFCFIFCLLCEACGALVPQPGMEPRPLR